MRNHLEFDLVVQVEMSFKDCFMFSSGGNLVWQSGTICENFVVEVEHFCESI